MASSQAVRQEAAAKGLYRPDAEHDLIIAAPSVPIPCAVTVRAF